MKVILNLAICIFATFFLSSSVLSYEDSYQDPYDDGYEEPEKPTYQLNCTLVSITKRTVNFDKRRKAIDWCASFGDYCTARRDDYKGWQAYYERKAEHESGYHDTWIKARLEALESFGLYIEEYNLKHEDFRSEIWYKKCYN